MPNYPILLRPVSKEIIWGGSKLKNDYGKSAPFDKIAESWELTVRPDENSVIANGKYAGMTLGQYISADRARILGTNGVKYDRFPLLIKFIDAADKLSIQVHPDDAYGLANEGELGKTEMWYIMDCEPGACLVYGLKEGCTTEEFAAAVAQGRTEEMLNFVPVKKGDVYFIPAGQVHAIGAGILIAEIQQNSNVTYRVYDYNRPGADGKPRELHTAKAIDVVKLRSEAEIDAIRFAQPKPQGNYEVLASCDYFTTRKYVTDSDNVAVFHAHKTSFLSLLILDAEDAVLDNGHEQLPLRKGDSYFLPAGSGEYIITGKSEFLTTCVN
ncbi:MAG: class I mannose-6-phosphate isomerase [Clostridia bacterium]|nr:class I mannose-6-phosphate isomerase [Clostridia bacterium]